MEVLFGTTIVPKELIDKILSYKGILKGVFQIAEDIWISDEVIDIHKDSTEVGKQIYGVILYNEDNSYRFSYDGRIFAIPMGTMYVINGRVPHGILQDKHFIIRDGVRRPPRFAFMAWNMPLNFTMDQFRRQYYEEIPFRQFFKNPIPFIG
jgi:hypothetical protein